MGDESFMIRLDLKIDLQSTILRRVALSENMLMYKEPTR